jgi:D-alanyl-D-alanine dipeptidase
MRRAVITLVMTALTAAAAQAQTPLIYLRDIDASIRQDMRYAGSDNFTGKPLPGYDAAECMLRRPVALALKRVQADLAVAGLSLKVYDCYRPAAAVSAMVRWVRDPKPAVDTTRFYPAVDKSKLLSGYISGRSAHSRGVAVDLTLIPTNAAPTSFIPGTQYGPCTAPQRERAPDNSVDMGTGYDCFDVKSHTGNASITAEQTVNRRILLDAMRRHGFTNYKRDWWHFSFDKADDGVAFNAPIRSR